MMHVDVAALEKKISESGMTKDTYAAALGVNASTVYRKLKASTSFTVGEMHKTVDILALTPAEAASIFFAQ